MDSVLVGVDRSQSSRRAVQFALERALVNSWHITIVHVINWSPYRLSTKEDNERRPLRRKQEIERARAEIIQPLLDWVAADKRFTNIDISTHIKHGRPSEVLADLAKDEGHDLIVVSRTGESNLRTAIFGSTASRLVQHAPVAVVVVP